MTRTFAQETFMEEVEEYRKSLDSFIRMEQEGTIEMNPSDMETVFKNKSKLSDVEIAFNEALSNLVVQNLKHNRVSERTACAHNAQYIAELFFMHIKGTSIRHRQYIEGVMNKVKDSWDRGNI